MSKIIGLWKTSWPNQGKDFLMNYLLPETKEKHLIPKRVADYLKNGNFIIGRRNLLVNRFNGKVIGSPELLCDDLYIWSNEYAYYVIEGLIEIDKSLLENMQKNNFVVPDLNASSSKTINGLLKESGFPELPDLI